jgi:hypothetical protein
MVMNPLIHGRGMLLRLEAESCALQVPLHRKLVGARKISGRRETISLWPKERFATEPYENLMSPIEAVGVGLLAPARLRA